MTRAVEGKRNRRRNPGNGPPETGSDAIQQVTMSRADETSAAPIVKTPITKPDGGGNDNKRERHRKS